MLRKGAFSEVRRGTVGGVEVALKQVSHCFLTCSTLACLPH